VTHFRHIPAALLALLLCLNAAEAAPQRQRRNRERQAQETVTARPAPKRSGYMGWKLENGDTVYVDRLQPAWIFASGNRGKEKLRRYYRLVHNFNKVYPYALVSRKLIREVDSSIAAGHLSRRQKEKYINGIQKSLMRNFMGAARHMTISQGQLLMKLIDRETGKSSYDIIRNYKSGTAAGFWQGIAKMFGTDMKRNYDPAGADRMTEELVRSWESGSFPALYFSIFGESPPKTKIPDSYLKYAE
jgi:hypothetical protein